MQVFAIPTFTSKANLSARYFYLVTLTLPYQAKTRHSWMPHSVQRSLLTTGRL
jgi:hypothetical protein